MSSVNCMVTAALLLLLFCGVSSATSNHDPKFAAEARRLLNSLGIFNDGSLEYKNTFELLVSGLEERSERKPGIHDDEGLGLSFSCGLCKTAVGVVLNLIAKNETEEQVISQIMTLCTGLAGLSDAVCSGAINGVKDDLWYIVHNVPDLTGEDFCGVFLEGTCLTDATRTKLRWTVPLLPTPKPPVVDVQPPPENSPQLKVLHFTDIHFDPYYEEGSLANCADPLCCQATSGNTSNPADAAGIWSDYRQCDIPLMTLENMLQHITQSNLKIDYIIWTGDIPSHAVWSQTHDEVRFTIQAVNKMIRFYFPDTPVFPAVGNHETVVTNSFPPPELDDPRFSMDWMYEVLTDQWMNWLPEDQHDTIRKTGYYTAQVVPGLRIIAINSNYGHAQNWWNILNYPDVGGMLAWLIQELDKAEQVGEKVHLLAHIPNGGDDTTPPFNENFHKIINRYESTIVAQFHGHTHDDEFQIHFDQDDQTRPIGVAYIAPSVTTYSYVNPAFRIYTVDGERDNSTFAVLDHHNYYLNLTDALLTNKPKWNLLYSAKAAYELEQLEGKNWLDLVNRMNTTDSVMQSFWNYRSRASGFSPTCDANCKTSMLEYIIAEPPKLN